MWLVPASQASHTSVFSAAPWIVGQRISECLSALELRVGRTYWRSWRESSRWGMTTCSGSYSEKVAFRQVLGSYLTREIRQKTVKTLGKRGVHSILLQLGSEWKALTRAPDTSQMFARLQSPPRRTKANMLPGADLLSFSNWASI